MTGNKNHDKTKQSIEKLVGFPLKIPIILNELELGNIKIDVEPNKQKLDTIKKSLYLLVLVELFCSFRFLKKEIELAFRKEKRYLSQKPPFYGFLAQFFLPEHQTVEFWNYLFNKDEDIFELIKLEGPISLRNSVVQNRINDWASDKNIAGIKINKLSDSLIEYALGSKDKPFKVGRPEIEVIRKFGTKWIKDLYQCIRLILKIAKKNQKDYQPDKISELIDQATREFLISLKEELEKEQDSEEKQKQLAKLKIDLKNYEYFKFFDPISECIKGDEYLKTEFINFNWEPNKFAKKIIAKLLDVSGSKIDKILYSKT